ncbi:MAG TPA: hypothetical protein VL943_11535, partial [Niabella sp.]|nr:hypothetical protein [Niabella sp.]
MKKIVTLSLLFLSLLLISCEKDKDEPNPDIVTGNYSGIIVGSTGAYQIKITESGATGTLIFEGVKYALESQNVLTKRSQIFLVDKSGDMVITIEADATGLILNPSFRIPGHENMEATILKETTTPAENYNGWRLNETASDFTNSIYNLSVNGNSFELISKTIASVNAEEVGNVKRIKGTVSRSGSQI